MGFPLRVFGAAVVLAVMAACQGGENTMALRTPSLFQKAPPGAAPGTCWGKSIIPAKVATITEQVLVTPASGDGHAATYRTETRQEIIRPRQESWFEAVCDDALTPDFVKSLQRALAVRGIYKGRISGDMSALTRRAVRLLQADDGVLSDKLSLKTARKLGLIAVTRPGPDE